MSKWVNAKKRLPDYKYEGCEFLVVHDDDPEIAIYEGEDEFGNGQWRHESHPYWHSDLVTHWRNLPNPPKKGMYW